LLQGADGQTIVSARSGLISFVQDEVAVDNIQIAFAPFSPQHLQRGERLQTGMGRAEVLLVPEVYLWLGEQGDLEMLRSDILDAQVCLRSGTLYVQIRNRPGEGKVSLLTGDAEIAFPRSGLYRIDALPSAGPQSLQVFVGRAIVSIRGKEIKVSSKRSLQFGVAGSGLNRPPRFDHARQDSFDKWTAARISTIDRAELRARESARKNQGDDSWTGRLPGGSQVPVPQ
jgi:hypothetical protein